jgi:hypothetical protein
MNNQEFADLLHKLADHLEHCVECSAETDDPCREAREIGLPLTESDIGR